MAKFLSIVLLHLAFSGAVQASASHKRFFVIKRDRSEDSKSSSWRSKFRESKSKKSKSVRRSNLSVRTTAYTHTESDHRRYGRKNAIGTTLKYGKTRSAAADWSIFPLGTKFRISGDSNLYVIDDYGSALVGKQTIDLYKPSRGSMNAWGVRHVTISVVEWGSPQKSLELLEERTAYRHVREMIKGLKSST